MIPYKSPFFFKYLWPGLVWRMPKDAKKIYLTFDDGPIPELTTWVLNLLEERTVKATFFCVGENIEKHPEVFQSIIKAGHSIGNHTHNHINGRKFNTSEYLQNISACDKALEEQGVETNLFRPPYGRLKVQQRRALSARKVIMWDVLSKDYDVNLSPSEILENSIVASSSGTIIVFHDNEKATENLKQVLPQYIEHFKQQGFQFDKL
ncbi:polysaccharide deacetylase family protein [Roseivirga sp.]|uniref:polysaccharide deacetylase family protein n=1 Tax=Roseivirga sp. TaxID=1964215 RepID=UPI003B8CF9D5